MDKIVQLNDVLCLYNSTYYF